MTAGELKAILDKWPDFVEVKAMLDDVADDATIQLNTQIVDGETVIVVEVINDSN